MPNFKNFYDEHLNTITEKYHQDLIKGLEGNHNISEIIGILIGHNSNYVTDVLNEYTNWLLENFDISPKQKWFYWHLTQ